MVVSFLDDDIVLYWLHGMGHSQVYQEAVKNAPATFCLRLKQQENFIEGLAPIPIGLITELCGPASSGKTQACLSFAVDFFMATSKKILFIDTENSFSIDRLLQIQSARYFETSGEQIQQLANAVFVIKEFSADGLLERLATLDELIVCENISCLILDSIAATCRSDSLTEYRKNEYLSECARQLKYLADKYALSCLITNQVVGNYDKTEVRAGSVRPALGLQWSHAVNVRYMLEPDPDSSFYRLRATKSPLGCLDARYKISTAGIIPEHKM